MAPYIAPEINARGGFWGQATSTLDWCEENYAMSHYVAEFWNTVSNILLVALPLLGMYRCQRDRVEARYTAAYLSGLAVGIGSVMFHGTLLYEMQLLDEIPMLVCSAALIYCLLEAGSPHNTVTTKGYIIIAVLSLYVTVVTIVYLFLHDPTFHEAAYGLLVLVVVVLGFAGLWRHLQGRYLGLGVVSIGFYLFGFILWNIDIHYCPSIRELRKASILSYGGFLTQLHGWWHIAAAIGCYLHVVTSSRVRMDVLGHQTSLKTCLGVPYLVVHRKKQK